MLRQKIVEYERLTQQLVKENKLLSSEIEHLEAEKAQFFDTQRRQRENMHNTDDLLLLTPRQKPAPPKMTPRGRDILASSASTPRPMTAPPKVTVISAQKGKGISIDALSNTITFSAPGTEEVKAILLTNSCSLQDKKPMYSEFKITKAVRSAVISVGIVNSRLFDAQLPGNNEQYVLRTIQND